MSSSHSFNPKHAEMFDIPTAILLQHFDFWYKKIIADNVNLFDGKRWVRMKRKNMQKIFPYFTINQIRRYTDKMIQLNLLIDGEYNAMKSDRTKWYALTDYAKEILGIKEDKQAEIPCEYSVGKSASPSGKYANPSGEFANSNIKEVDISYRYLLLYSKIEKNLSLLTLVAMQNKLKIITVKNSIEMFVKQSISVNEFYNNNKEIYKHFQNWVGTQKLSDIDLEKELNWFLKTFNTISGREYKKTEEIQQLFSKQFSVGFSGNEMKTAIKNLYSSSIENKFHKQHNFKFATPEYLLKGDNMNKYLNFKI